MSAKHDLTVKLLDGALELLRRESSSDEEEAEESSQTCCDEPDWADRLEHAVQSVRDEIQAFRRASTEHIERLSGQGDASYTRLIGRLANIESVLGSRFVPLHYGAPFLDHEVVGMAQVLHKAIGHYGDHWVKEWLLRKFEVDRLGLIPQNRRADFYKLVKEIDYK